MAAIELGNIFVRFYHGNGRDEAIAQYLGQFDKSPKGVKQTRAKELLYLGLQALEQEEEVSRRFDPSARGRRPSGLHNGRRPR